MGRLGGGSSLDGARTPGKLARIGSAGVIVLATAIILGALGVRWGYYRHGHIVTRDAILSGVVTHLGSRIEGQVASVEVELANRVVPGQVVARLADQHLVARVSLAHAELERTKNQLSVAKSEIEHQSRRLEVELRRADANVGARHAELEAAQSELPKWEREYQRISELLSGDAASPERMDRVAAARDVAVATAAARRANREAAQHSRNAALIELNSIEIRVAQLRVLEAEVEAKRSLLASAEANLEATYIRAPDYGWVVATTAEPGSSVRVGDQILSLWIGDRLWVDAWVDETDLADIRIGGSADVTLAAYDRRHFAGKVEAIGAITKSGMELSEGSVSASILPATAKINVRISLDTVDVPLMPGLSATVGIERAGDEAHSAFASFFNTSRTDVEMSSVAASRDAEHQPGTQNAALAPNPSLGTTP